jgi:hypothetical protein
LTTSTENGNADAGPEGREIEVSIAVTHHLLRDVEGLAPALDRGPAIDPELDCRAAGRIELGNAEPRDHVEVSRFVEDG